MIRNLITPELKNRFSEEIKKTLDTGKERGFLICRNKDNSLSATESCEGDECRLSLAHLDHQCDFKVQGDFHTHPRAKDAIQYAQEKLGKNVSLEEATRFVKDVAKGKGTSLAGPSYGDILSAIASSYVRRTLGTTCVGVDIEPD